jgi:hypothetical protein
MTQQRETFRGEAAENEMSTVAEKEASTALANLKAAARRGVGVYLRWEDVIWRALIVAGVAVMQILVTTVIAESRAKAGVSAVFHYFPMAVLLFIACFAPRRNCNCSSLFMCGKGCT